jgi:hypothetical protein
MSITDFAELTGYLLFAWVVGFGGGTCYVTFKKLGDISS